jgi:O-antigen/teichoic acid export membrane protein
MPIVVALLFGLGGVVTPADALSGALLIWLMTSYVYLRGAVRAEGEVPRVEGVHAGQVLVQILFFTALWAAGTSSVWAYAMAMGLALAIGQTQLLRRLRHWKLRGDTPRIPLWKRGIVTQAGVLSMTVAYRIDRLLLAALLGASSVGVYAVAVALSESLLLLATAGGQVLLDRYARFTGTGDARRTSRYGDTPAAIVGVTGIGAIVMAIAAHPLVDTIFGFEFIDAVEPLRILTLAACAAAVWRVLSARLVGEGLLAWFAWAGLIAMIVAIGSGLILVRTYGVAGAAWASVMSYSAAALIAWTALYRRRRIHSCE